MPRRLCAGRARPALEARPLLRRAYLAVGDLAPYAESAGRLGFAPVCQDQGLLLSCAMLDFGSGSVDAWLCRLVRRAGTTRLDHDPRPPLQGLNVNERELVATIDDVLAVLDEHDVDPASRNEVLAILYSLEDEVLYR